MRFLLSLYEICEDIKIHALVNIMPTKGDITRENQNYYLTTHLNKKKFFLYYVRTSLKFMPNINLIYYLIAGSIFGALALKTGIPAAPLAGALIGASLLSISGKVEIAEWPIGTRTILEIGIGTVIGTSLTKDALVDIQNLWRPAILITFTLIITGLVIGLWTSRLLNIDVITTILGAAPGGISGMSLVGSEYGVGAAVATLHAVRLITVLLILPLVVKCLNIFGVIKS